eukprot:14778627-Ditylum_brightwellii.AAC.1
MVLHIHSDASYLSAPPMLSRFGGHFFLSNMPQDLKKPEDSQPQPNRPIHSVCKHICNAMVLTTEAEIKALYTNAHRGEKFQITL